MANHNLMKLQSALTHLEELERDLEAEGSVECVCGHAEGAHNGGGGQCFGGGATPDCYCVSFKEIVPHFGQNHSASMCASKTARLETKLAAANARADLLGEALDGTVLEQKHLQSSYDYQASVRKDLENALQKQIDSGPLLHSSGGKPFAITYLDRRWVPVEERNALKDLLDRAEAIEADLAQERDDAQATLDRKIETLASTEAQIGNLITQRDEALGKLQTRDGDLDKILTELRQSEALRALIYNCAKKALSECEDALQAIDEGHSPKNDLCYSIAALKEIFK